MKTPAGIECPYFYGDYYRGKKTEECKLLSANRATGRWTPDLCKTCPVPGITRANACEHMSLTASIKRGLLKSRKVVVTAFCSKSQSVVKVPEIGCELCHQDLNFIKKPDA